MANVFITFVCYILSQFCGRISISGRYYKPMCGKIVVHGTEFRYRVQQWAWSGRILSLHVSPEMEIQNPIIKIIFRSILNFVTEQLVFLNVLDIPNIWLCKINPKDFLILPTTVIFHGRLHALTELFSLERSCFNGIKFYRRN